MKEFRKLSATIVTKLESRVIFLAFKNFSLKEREFPDLTLDIKPRMIRSPKTEKNGSKTL